MALFMLFVSGAITGWLMGHVLKGYVFTLLDDIFVGIAGGLIGGWLAGQLITKVPNAVIGINVPSILLVTFLGAVVLIINVRLLRYAAGVRVNASR